ncbi:MAG: DNA polymerase III subunit alpha, partial [Lachnospiraceae bacterium]|nr:DNA polymerase III subunit alpha [Lachnospiraceae bacterium]
ADMADFAKYAFNKSHAAAYAVVAYQTAYLKYYYPVEYMAALITSVIDNAGKTSEYILVTRNMGIQILPPDINEGDVGFSVSGDAIRYALTAIKNVGRPVIEGIVAERNAHGPFTNLKDFIVRTAECDVNKRAVENFIKAGAFDSLGGNRRQYISIYSQVIDGIQKDRKNNMAGQMSLFDIAGEEDKEEFDIVLPNLSEFPKETILQFEKEVLGVYVSGHPIEEYQQLWKRVITNPTTDFMIEEETGRVNLEDRQKVVIGGIIAEKKTKYTKNDKLMGFLTIEDMVGSVEVLVFPRQYETHAPLLTEDAKVFVHGIVSAEEEKDAKVICEKVVSFEQYPRKIWIKFADRTAFEALQPKLETILAPSDGIDEVVYYLEAEKQMKALAKNKTVRADSALLETLKALVGEGNVQVV